MNLSKNSKGLLVLVFGLLLLVGIYVATGKGQAASGKTTCQNLLDRWSEEKPENLTAKIPYAGEASPVKYASSNFPEVSDFKKEINEGVEKGANFNGHYSVVEWSCGEECQNHAVIDVKTGDVLTFGVVSTRGVRYSIDSPVLVVNPEEKMSDLDIKDMSLDDAIYWTTFPREYHVIEESSTTERFRMLCAENPFVGKDF